MIICSPILAICHLGVMILGLALFKDSVPQGQQVERRRGFQLTEEDVLRAARAVLPIANSMISTAQVIFSGDSSMTLKVLPVLLFGAKYGSLVTVCRLLAKGVFSSSTLPNLYICYSSQIHRRGIIYLSLLSLPASCSMKCSTRTLLQGLQCYLGTARLTESLRRALCLMKCQRGMLCHRLQ